MARHARKAVRRFPSRLAGLSHFHRGQYGVYVHSRLVSIPSSGIVSFPLLDGERREPISVQLSFPSRLAGLSHFH